MGVNTKSFDSASDMITFSRASGAYGLTKVGYGSELVTNGTFDSGTSSWTALSSATLSVVSGALRVTNVGANFGKAEQSLSVTSGNYYKVTFDKVGGTSANANFRVGTTSAGLDIINNVNVITNASYEYLFQATASTIYLSFVNDGTDANYNDFDNVSVKEVTYNSSDPSATLKLIYHPNDVPRIEYNTDGTAKGLLIEGARTNLLTYSEDFSTWSKFATTVTANAAVAPDGATTADKVVENTGTSARTMTRSAVVTPPASTAYTISAFVKAGGRTRFQLRMYGSFTVNPTINVNLTAATATVQQGSVSNPSIVAVGNDWYKCSFTSTTDNTNPLSLQFLLQDDAGASTYLGDGTSGIYIWGAQMEAGSFATSYIKTENATATRALDLAEINVSNFINKSAGTFLATFNYSDPTNADNNYVFSGSSNARVFYNNAGNSVWQTYDGSAGTTFGDVDSGEVYKLAVAVKTDSNISTAKNGTIQTTRTVNTALMTSIEAYPLLAIGGASSSSSYQKLNGHIKSIQYYPRRLTDAQIQRLTQPISTPTLSLTFDGQATSFTEDSIHG